MTRTTSPSGVFEHTIFGLQASRCGWIDCPHCPTSSSWHGLLVVRLAGRCRTDLHTGTSSISDAYLRLFLVRLNIPRHL